MRKRKPGSIWTQPVISPVDATDLIHARGGRTKKWLVGVVVAALPVIYGVVCIAQGRGILPLGRGESVLHGKAAGWLGAAYIAFGLAIHFHYFWGLSERSERFSFPAKCLAWLVFLVCLANAALRIF